MGKEQDGAVICMALLSRGCRAELCAGRAVTARCSLHLGETLFCLDGKKKIRQERANQKCWDFLSVNLMEEVPSWSGLTADSETSQDDDG